MQLSENKPLVVIVGIILIIFGTWWLRTPSDRIKQEDLLYRIQSGYTQQFCSVIFPRISNCVTMSSDKCPNLVAKHLDSCLLQLKLDLPSRVSHDEGKVIYEKVGACFEKDIHDDLVANFMVNTPECQQILS